MQEDEKFFTALRKDVQTITKDAWNCFVHSVAIFAILSVLGAGYSAALTTASLLGAVKLFSTDSNTNYGEHTRQQLSRRLSHDNRRSRPTRSS